MANGESQVQKVWLDTLEAFFSDASAKDHPVPEGLKLMFRKVYILGVKTGMGVMAEYIMAEPDKLDVMAMLRDFEMIFTEDKDTEQRLQETEN